MQGAVVLAFLGKSRGRRILRRCADSNRCKRYFGYRDFAAPVQIAKSIRLVRPSEPFMTVVSIEWQVETFDTGSGRCLRRLQWFSNLIRAAGVMFFHPRSA